MAVRKHETVAFDRPGGETCPRATRRPIDMAQLERQTMGDRKLEQEVLGLFSQQAALALDSMVGAGPSARKRLVHTLKGTARSLGAMRLAAACERVEGAPLDSGANRRLAAEVRAVRDYIASISR